MILSFINHNCSSDKSKWEVKDYKLCLLNRKGNQTPIKPGKATFKNQSDNAAKAMPVGFGQKAPINTIAKLDLTPASPTANEGIALANR